ncbi:hypothetical protein AHF37_07327 [Paragonimus kellicotti]|nr:hypothetical protein AHF37_07327 [Paragonimus kellicotti]
MRTVCLSTPLLNLLQLVYDFFSNGESRDRLGMYSGRLSTFRSSTWGHVQVIQSPSPYLIGVDSRFFDFFRMPPGGGGVTYVDLDTKNFIPTDCPGQTVLDAKLLPAEPLKQLRTTLTHLHRQIRELHHRRSEASTNFLLKCLFTDPGSELAQSELNALRLRTDIGVRVKEAFMQFMARLLKNYRAYLIPVRDAERDQLFNSKGLSFGAILPSDFLFEVSLPLQSVESTRIIGPPAWPLPAAIFGQSLADPGVSTKRHVSDCKRTVAPRPFDLVPIRWNVRLLDRLAVYAYRLQALSMDDTFRLELASCTIDEHHTRPDLLSDTTGLSILANGWQSMTPYRLARGPSILPDHILSAVVDNPSPLPPRAASSTVLGLTGLPTKFPIPVGSNVIFRRSPLEIRQTVERYRETIQEGGVTWAKQLVAAIYSLWFMMLPAHLAALHAHVVDEPHSYPDEPSTEQRRNGDPEPNVPSASDVINVCLSDAVRVATRLAEHRIECPDQVNHINCMNYFTMSVFFL